MGIQFEEEEQKNLRLKVDLILNLFHFLLGTCISILVCKDNVKINDADVLYNFQEYSAHKIMILRALVYRYECSTS